MSTGSVMPITPAGLSQLLAATTTSSSITLPECDAVWIYNSAAGTTAFLAVGESAATAVIPTAGTPATGIAIPAGATLLLGMGLNLRTLAAIVASGTTNLYLTPVSGTQH